MILQDTYTLSNGLAIPKLGFGTWLVENTDVAQAVRAALTIGYRHVDTAQAYGTNKASARESDPAVCRGTRYS